MAISIEGIVPVMLTPFTGQDTIDDEGLAALVEWYLDNGADALFAVCQSSEMQKLSLDERVALARSVVEKAAGRAPVIASGHISDRIEDQIAELQAMADTGVDGLVLVTNRLDPDDAGTEAFKSNLDRLIGELPADMPLGLYECPAPYRRLLSDEELAYCRDTGRFVVLKDVSCDIDTVRRRVELTEGSPLAIINANAAIAFEAMQAGSRGFSGVFTNFHPDLYAYVYANRDRGDDPLISDLVTFLALAAMAEGMGYPRIAKEYHRELGTFENTASRVVDYDVFDRHWASRDLLNHIKKCTTRFRTAIARQAEA
ncbi:dihydrodipicolinate synthase family protein [Hoeflea sp. WL0058]|uniref:Dihydrodipicolinate synthase family protein n=1 Tax=Flavimaribacter sediminis TaxID=2865987 RepID=A0AAE3CZD7_9HYPH|nr:dihydrodipicolinate synthase family protein [Flavimaribacter sediminis]MBW8637175.1 dihydrodipicolinate synthase family protein [Flavimaribacter sediminis]